MGKISTYIIILTRNIYGQNFNVYNNIIDKKYIWAKFQHNIYNNIIDKKYIWAKISTYIIILLTRNIYGQNFNIYNNIIDKKYIWAKFQHT